MSFRQRGSHLQSLGVSVVLLAAALATVLFRQEITDWWALRGYNPPAEIQALANTAQVTSYGRKVFYATKPSIENRQNFSKHCQKQAEKTIILGCYNGRNIYIYNVTDERLNGVKEVTAMHEMLHAAYDRLSGSERQTLNSQLTAQFNNLNNPRISDLVAHYQKAEPGEVENELHSILGTEIATLSPELETYYQRYFANRQSVVALAERYESVFTQSQKQIAEIDAQLAVLRQSITSKENELTKMRATIDSQKSQMQAKRSSGDIDAYNAMVGPYNALIRQYNNLLETTKATIVEHNNFVTARNQLAVTHNNLAESLDSDIPSLSDH